MKTVIKNAHIISGGELIHGCYLYLSDDKIAAVSSDLHECDQAIDANGHYLSAGFIDMHTHGGGGFDFMDGTVEAFLRASELHAKHGTTTLFPTLSGDISKMERVLGIFDQMKHENPNGACLPGLHLEGPYFALSQKGAQDERYIKAPERSEYLRLLQKSDSIRRWSAAPELPGSQAFARALTSRGILPSMAHTDASCTQAEQAFQWGFTHVTHLYSCTSTVHRKNAYRYGGVIEAAYLTDGMTVEIIADGIHLPSELLRLVYKLKGADRTALVTDSMRGAGMPDGESILGSLDDGFRIIIENDVAKLPDRSAFAGSVSTMDRLVRNMVQLASVPLIDAVKMATVTPAKIMKLSDRGDIQPGMHADLCIFSENIKLDRVIIGGRTIFEK